MNSSKFFIILILSSVLFLSKSNKEINEEYIKSIINNFYLEIKDIFELTNFDELFQNEKILFMIPEFTTDKVLISIQENEIINLRLKYVTPSLRKEIPRLPKIRVVRNLIVQLNDFELELNIKIKNFPDEQNSSNITFVGKPIINYNPIVKSNYIEMREKFNSKIETGEFNNNYIIPIINKILYKIFAIINNK